MSLLEIRFLNHGHESKPLLLRGDFPCYFGMCPWEFALIQSTQHLWGQALALDRKACLTLSILLHPKWVQFLVKQASLWTSPCALGLLKPSTFLKLTHFWKSCPVWPELGWLSCQNCHDTSLHEPFYASQCLAALKSDEWEQTGTTVVPHKNPGKQVSSLHEARW